MALAVDPLVFYVGNTSPAILQTITVDDAAFDLTGSTVKFQMRAPGSATLKVDAAATIDDAVAGEVSYSWQTGDLDTAGEWLVWWEVTLPGGAVQEVGEALILVREHNETRLYGSVEELKQTLSIGGGHAGADLEVALEAASREVDRLTGRFFYATTAPEIRYFTTPRGRALARITVDIVSLSEVATAPNGDGTFSDVWTASDYVLGDANATLDGFPYEWIAPHELGSYSWPAYSDSIRLTGSFGWPAVPPEVEQATTIIASQLLQRARLAPFGIVALGVDQSAAARLSRVDPTVQALLSAYVRAPFA